MSMPPAALAMITGLPDARSSTMLRYSSRVICSPSSTSTRRRRALRAGLMRDERHADHRGREFDGVLGASRQLDAAALAAAAGVDLRLDDDHGAAETAGDVVASAGIEVTSPRGTGHRDAQE
jgi:hypothetical protein